MPNNSALTVLVKMIQMVTVLPVNLVTNLMKGNVTKFVLTVRMDPVQHVYHATPLAIHVQQEILISVKLANKILITTTSLTQLRTLVFRLVFLAHSNLPKIIN